MGEIIIRRCPRCGVLFDCYCRSTTRCWCFGLQLDAATLERIAKNYSGCLCPECLSALSENKPGRLAAAD